MTTTVQQLERTIQHQRRRRVFTPAVAERGSDPKEWLGIQGGVPRAAPRQFPDISPEAIERFENAKHLRLRETQEKQ